MSNLQLLPFTPISIPSLLEREFFISDDARIVRAGLWLIEAAWRSSRPGAIPSGFEALSSITRLSEAEVTKHFDVLTQGWELREDGWLHCEEIEYHAQNIQDRFAPELETIAESLIVGTQGSGVQFDLVSEVVVKKKRKNTMRLIDKDFSMDSTTTQRAIAEGYAADAKMDWLMNEFRDYAHSKARKYADWQAACRSFLGNQITRERFEKRFGYPLGATLLPASVNDANHSNTSARTRLRQVTEGRATFAQQSAAHNSELMARGLAAFQGATHS